jgi:hypothetical protein
VLRYIIQMSAWLAQLPFASFYVGKTKWYDLSVSMSFYFRCSVTSICTKNCRGAS